jgi:predicted Fe-Mo cluster-binding NifX family protein
MPSRVCVSAAGSSIDSQIDPRFGRCACFIVADTDTMDCQCLPNAAHEAPHGAGIQAAQMVANQKVQAVITGMVGPNAQRVLSAAGIEIITGVSGTVRDAIQRYKTGQLRGGQGPSGGLGFGPGRGRGGGLGRRGGESCRSWPSQIGGCQSPASVMREERLMPAPTSQDELTALEERKKSLMHELAGLESTIDELRRRRPNERPA